MGRFSQPIFPGRRRRKVLSAREYPSYKGNRFCQVAAGTSHTCALLEDASALNCGSRLYNARRVECTTDHVGLFLGPGPILTPLSALFSLKP